MELVGEGLSGLTGLSSYEAYFSEGDSGELRFYLDRSLYQDKIDQLETEILGQGVVLTAPIAQDAGMLIIKFQKAIAPLLIIGGAIVAVVGSVVGWQLLKPETLGLPLWAWVGGIGLLYIMRGKKWLGKR